MFNIFDRLKNWKDRSNQKASDIKKLEKTIRDLTKSRDKWKTKAQKKDEVILNLKNDLKKICNPKP